MKTLKPHQRTALSASTAVFLGLAITACPGAFVQNPSFESSWNPTWPHYGPIDGWVGGSGVNDRSLDRGGPFDDNGLTPDQNRVAFQQQTGNLSQNIAGLTVGQLYWIQFYYNTRGDVLSGTCDITTQFGGTNLDAVTGIQRVTAPEGTNAITVPFYARSVPFVAQSDSGTLTFHVNTAGDRTALFDAVTIVPRDTNDVVVMNPSFEASGTLPAVGPLTNGMAGWAGTGTVGVDTAGGLYADNGAIPDQDLVAFIEGPGSLTQTIRNLVPGTPYQLLFAYNSRSGNTPHLQALSGTTVLFETDVASVGGANPFLTNLTTFTVNTNVLTLTFAQTKTGTDAVLIDNVRLLGQTAVALPPLQVTPLHAELAPGQSVTITVTVPSEKLARGPADITLASTDPTVVQLAGADTNGIVTLHYTQGGATAQTLSAVAVARGAASVNVTDAAGLVVPNGVLVHVVTSFVRNPSFEAETAATNGYGPILAWTSTGQAGLNTAAQPFAANSGPIPDRVQVAFIQGVGSLAQQITGLTPGANYWLQFRYTLQDIPDPAGPAIDLAVRFGGLTVAAIHHIIPLSQSGASAYYFTNVMFAPTNATGTLEFDTLNPAGAATLLLDAVNIVRRDAGEIVVQNPSFEASGAMDLYIEGPNTALLCGWDITGGGRGTASGGPFADNGAVPDQDQVLFLQGAGGAQQTVSGFTAGQTYTLIYSVNTRGCCPASGVVTHYQALAGTLGSPPIQFEEDLSPVGNGAPYYRRYVAFTADGPDQTIGFQHVPNGDRTLLLDNIRVLPGQVGAPPMLSISQQADGSVLVSWPATALGFVLQSAPAPFGPWTYDPALVATQGSVKAAIVPPSQAQRYYRLSL